MRCRSIAKCYRLKMRSKGSTDTSCRAFVFLLGRRDFTRNIFAVYRKLLSKKIRFSIGQLYKRQMSGNLLARGVLLPDSQLRSVVSLIPSRFDASSCVNPALVRAARIVICIVSPLFCFAVYRNLYFNNTQSCRSCQWFSAKNLRFSIDFFEVSIII